MIWLRSLALPLSAALSALLPGAAGITVPVARPTGSVAIPASWTFRSEYSDEFNVFDDTKWHRFNPHWEGRMPGVFAEDQVSVAGGQLNLGVANCEDCGDATYKTGTVVSRMRLRYGYLEISARMAAAAVSSAFWLYAEDDDQWTEIDVFENGGVRPFVDAVNTNAHVFKLPLVPKLDLSHQMLVAPPSDTSKTFHRYGLLWNHNHIEWFIDGRSVRRLSNRYWHQSLNIVFDIEIMKDWMGIPADGELPATFHVDYLRVWSPPESTANQ